jgi:ankyrin repeat protein
MGMELDNEIAEDDKKTEAAQKEAQQWASYFFNLILYRQSADVAAVLKKHPDAIHWKYPGDQTPLMCAVRQKHNEITEMLLKAGAPTDPRVGQTGWTALIYAGRDDNAAALDLLIKYGASVKEKCDNGDTALTQAIEGWHSFTAIRLIELGADLEPVTWTGKTPLLNAAENGDAAVCAALIRAGANIDAVDRNGMNALDLARKCGDPSYNTVNQKWLDTIAVLEPVFTAKLERERQALCEKLGDEMTQGTAQSVAVGPALKLKPRAPGF